VTTIELVGDAELRGSVSCPAGGSIVLDYSEYDGTVEADLGAGWDMVIVPELELPTGFTLPQLAYQFGSASGIQGYRLGGFEDWLARIGAEEVGGFFNDYAVGPVAKIIGSPGNDNLRGMSPSPTNNPREYMVTLELASDTRNVGLGLGELDFSGTPLGDVFGAVSLDMPGTEPGEGPLTLTSSLDLQFTFGLDDAHTFYIDNPSIVGRITLGHDEPLNVSLSLGPVGVGIEDGNVSFDVGLAFGAEGRFTSETLADIEVGAPTLASDSSYDVELPLRLEGALAGFSAEPALITAFYNTPDFPSPLPGDATLGDLFATIPVAMQVQNLSALLGSQGVSLDAVLDGIKSVLNSIAGDNGLVNKELPVINQSLVQLLGTDTDIVTDIIGAIDTVQENLSDIQRLEIDLNEKILEAIGIEVTDDQGDPVDFTTVRPARDRLAALSPGLNAQSTDDEIALALARTANLEQFNDLRTDRDVVAAYNALDDLDLDENSTDEQIAEALAGSDLGTYIDYRDTLDAYETHRILTLTYSNSILTVDFAFEKHLTKELGFELNLEDLANDGGVPQEVKDLIGEGGVFSVDVGAAGELGIDAFARFELGFGFDLSNVFEPEVFVQDDTGVTIGLEVSNTEPLDFEAGITVGGGLGLKLAVDDGSANLGIQARLGLADDSAGDGRYLLSEVSGALGATVSGSASLDLPLYFPTPSLPMGGTTQDLNGDGYGDNVLHVGTGFDSNGGFKGIEVITPDFASGIGLFSILNDPANVLDGLEGIFDTIKSGLDSKFASLGLPLVGEAFHDAAGFVDGLRDDLLGEQGDYGGYEYPEGSLGRALESAAEEGRGTVDLIRDAIWDHWGDYLVIETVDQHGRYQYTPVTSADQIEITADAGSVQFNFTLSDEIFAYELPIDFDVSVPGLGLDVDGGVRVALDYVFAFGFGFDQDIGLYVDTTGASAGGEEFRLELSATTEYDRDGDDVPDPLGASATLGFLQLDINDYTVDDPADSWGAVCRRRRSGQRPVRHLHSGPAGRRRRRQVGRGDRGAERRG